MSKKITITIVVLIIFILAGITGIAFLMLHSVKPHAEEVIPIEKFEIDKTKAPSFYGLPNTVFMLKSPLGESHMLVATFHLQVYNDAQKETVKKYAPAIQDILHQTINTMTIDDVKSPRGQIYLKSEVTKKINAYFIEKLHQEIIFDIYYSDYITTYGN